MAGQDLNRSIKIYIDGSEAAKGIEPVKKAIADLEAKLGKLTGQEADYEEKSKQLKKQLESKNRTLQNYEKKVQETDRVLKNLSGATYQELLAVRKQITKSLENEVRGTAQYNAALEQKRRVTEALTRASKEMRIEVGCQGTTFGKAANLVNQYAGLFTTTVASVTGLSMAMRSSVQAYADMEEAESNVRKYTGMTTEQVKELNEELQKMDTRTARDKLNALAGDAGRLGITAKQDVLDFVDAADKINVALGEDLGEDAVANIGKLAQMFGEDDRMGLRGAMLATGSAINEVAQNSSAAEAYLVEFTARVAGVAHQAGISQADILGFAASMDENMLRNETSATAYQNILLKMMTDTEKFAKVAGLNVQEFAKLVRTDANEALLTFASALQKRGGMADLAPLFGDLKTEGAGVASMLAVLAGKAEEVRSRQELANQAYQDGTSILKEFNVQNTTVQAGLDKAKKGFNEVAIQLGEKLLPLMSHMISGSGMLVRGMLVVVETCVKYSSTLGLLTAMVAGYVVALQAEVMWNKAVVFWNDKVVVGMKKLYAVLVAHPWMALAAASMTVIAYMRDLSRASSDAARNQKLLNDVLSSATTEAKNETRELETLLKVARDKTASDDERRKAIKRLNDIAPDYLGNLSLETINTTDADTAIKKYTASILANIKAKALKAKIEEIENQKQNLKENPDQASAWYDPITSGFAKIGSDAERVANTVRTLFTKGSLDGWNEATQMQQNYATSAMEAWRKRYTDEMNKLNETQKVLQEELEKTIKESLIVGDDNDNNNNNNTTTPGTPLDDEELKKALKAKKAAYQREQSELMKLYVSGKDESLRTEEQYNQRLLELKKKYLNEVISLAGKESAEGSAAQKELGEIAVKEKELALKSAIEAENELYAQQRKELREAYINQTDEQLSSYELFKEAEEQLEMAHLQRTLEIAGLDKDARIKIEEQLLDFKLKCQKEFEDAQKKGSLKQQKTDKKDSKIMEAEYKKRFGTMKGYADEFGSAVGQVLSGQKNALEAFGDVMIDVVFDILDQMIQAKLNELAMSAAAATAEGTMKEISSKGIAGIGTSAMITAAVSGLLMTAKTALKGLLGKRPSKGGEDADSTSGNVSHRVAVSQHAAGKYDVIGADDGQTYRGVPYLGTPESGIITHPALISEQGGELIINAEDLRRLQQHINYPLVLEAIADVRKGGTATVNQYASGKYNEVSLPDNPAATNDVLGELVTVLKQLSEDGIPASVVLSDLERKKKMRDRARRIGSKNRKKNQL